MATGVQKFIVEANYFRSLCIREKAIPHIPAIIEATNISSTHFGGYCRCKSTHRKTLALLNTESNSGTYILNMAIRKPELKVQIKTARP